MTLFVRGLVLELWRFYLTLRTTDYRENKTKINKQTDQQASRVRINNLTSALAEQPFFKARLGSGVLKQTDW